MSIYVEILIRGPIKAIWRKTQTPELHELWDLRFTDIEYLPRADDEQPQRFLYQTRIGFGLAIHGEGESVGSRNNADGSRTSSLRFWSDDSKSLIKDGAGFWQYLVQDDGVRFLTRYDYSVRFGRVGYVFDSIIFRPLLGWATAWSFDRLRLWIEKSIDPAMSLRFAVLHVLATITIALVWIYQGAIPKLIFLNADELAMLTDAGFPASAAPAVLKVVGLAEIVLGCLVIVFAKMRWPFVLTIALMVAATLGVIANSPYQLAAAFNPLSLNALMSAMAAVGWACIGNFPTASKCLRRAQKVRP